METLESEPFTRKKQGVNSGRIDRQPKIAVNSNIL